MTTTPIVTELTQGNSQGKVNVNLIQDSSPTQRGLMAIADKVALNEAVRAVLALPNPPDENEVVRLLSNKHIYQESRGTSFTDKFTAASSPGGGDDSQGVNRISDMPYGEFSPTFAPFIDALYWDDDTQRIILQLRSFIAPGTVNLSFSCLLYTSPSPRD